ncbi:cilia- and flagella-associated protein 70 [Anthonomus grandis grandis]|uniref:cilia- and flagella-associated protein 70 n=1 Tax=Anthonomus grandis grandis TaxID=2921223 RepID=UPI0021664344|nr:cilia- and flagella-associated protein 70 [Anthonomus grandis grandis]
MSTKKSEKTKKSAKDKGQAVPEEEEHHQESTPEVVLEKPDDLRTIVVKINGFKNILPLYPVSDVKASITYLERELGDTQLIPVTDDNELLINESFEFTIDVQNNKQLDQLASYPVFITTMQSSGSLDSELYERLQKNQEVQDDKPKTQEEIESLFSIYEAFTGERPSVQIPEIGSKKKKGKRSSKSEKSQVRSKSAMSKDSKTSKKSKGSKESSKADSKSKSDHQTVIKTETYGMSVIDLIPLFYGEISFFETLSIQPVKQSCEILSTFKNFPTVSVTVYIKEKIKIMDFNNILNFTVESICNVPQLMTGDIDCKICIMLPNQQNHCYPVIFSNPKIALSAPKKQVPKRWPGIQSIGYNANTTKYLIDDNLSEITNKANLNVEEGFKEDAVRIEFNYLKRNILFKQAMPDFSAKIMYYKKLVLEIYLTPKSKKSQRPYEALSDDTADDPHPKTKVSKSTPPYLHLMAVFDIVTLLYPGVTKLHVATPVKTFTYEEAAAAGLEDSYFMPKPKVDLNTARTSKSKLDTARGKKKGAEKKEKVSKKEATKEDKNMASQLPLKPEEPPLPEPSVQVYNEDGKLCFIVVEFELLKPLVPKREPEDLRASLLQMQMDALQSSKVVLNKNVADDFYKQTIRNIIDDLNKQWTQYNAKINTIPSTTYADFIEYLQKEGAYQSYMNSIVTSATLLISNKYKCEDRDFKNSKTYQSLVSELFSDLISQMHSILNTLVSNGLRPLGQSPGEGNFFYAKEAAALNLCECADRYFLQRILSAQNADFWYDYAVYNLEIGDADKAFECLREAIAIKPTHKYALLIYGALLMNKGNEHDAEICFLNVLISESKWAEGWCILYLFYNKCSRPDGMEMALDMARKHSDYQRISDYILEFEDLEWSSTQLPNTLFFTTATLLLKMRLYDWVETALAEEVLVPKHYGYVNYLLAVVSYFKRDYDHALEHVDEAKESLGTDYAIQSLSGHAHFVKGNLERAKECYYHVINSFDRPDDIHLVYLNCAEVLTDLGDDQNARKLLLITCKHHQTPQVWYRIGKLYFRENDLLSAEECFNEANLKDNQHADSWGYLTLVNLKLNRLHEAEQCYQQAVKSKLADPELIQMIVDGFTRANS